MFRGWHEHTIDAKGRVSLPARFREVLNVHYGPGLIVTVGFDGCLQAYPLNEWKSLEDKIMQMPQLNPNVVKFKRFFVAGATECTVDSVGRILIPPMLRQHAGLEKAVVFSGLLTYIEIWDKAGWDQAFQGSEKDIWHVVGKLGDLGLEPFRGTAGGEGELQS